MDSIAFRKLSYGLYIVTSAFEGKDAGCVVNTLSQVTSSPAKVSVAINKNNFTEKIIEKSGIFTAVVLSQETSMDTIGIFGFQSSENNNKFESVSFEIDENKIKYPTDKICAKFSCKVLNQVDLGTHVMFIGEVIDAEVISNEEPMTYSYYHQVKNGTTPKNAPSYQEEAKKTGYRCTVCGYIYEGEPLPDDFICPICKQPASKFVKL